LSVGVNSNMSDLKPKAANALAACRPFASSLSLAFLFIAAGTLAAAQSTISTKGPTLNGDGSIAAQHQALDGSDSGNGGLDSTIAERRMKLMNNERRKSLVSDSDKLFKLATELNNEIGHSNSGSFTPDQLRKVAEIEKLARNVRDKMTMTVSSPAASYFPVDGPPFIR